MLNSSLSVHAKLSDFAIDVQRGLSLPRKKISSKHLYDTRGSELFCEIMSLSEYYPTNAEKEIFENYGTDFFDGNLKENFQLVELGAGDGVKTRILIEKLLQEPRKFGYVPVDICKNSVEGLTTQLNKEFPQLSVNGAVADYTDYLKSQAHLTETQKVILFLGSNIGNYTLEESRSFLKGLRQSMNPGDLILIGFDLKKDITKLMQAYNDSKGVTAEFNLNLLRRMNHELGSSIELDSFIHYGFYNPFSGAMESCLLSIKAQDIFFPALEQSFHFDAYEALHLEYSFKYTTKQINDFAIESGFELLHNFTDSESLFIDSVWRTPLVH